MRLKKMLETTILKVTHAGEEEARKLLPYIQNCHVYAPEAATQTEEGAQTAENIWENILKKDISWSKVKEAHETTYNREDSELRAYRLKENNYLLRQKRKPWYLERFTQQESDLVWQLKDRADLSLRYGKKALLQESFNEYFSFIKQNIHHYSEMDEMRDKEIARNIVQAEERIRARYPELAEINPLQFVVRIGCLHQPEKYLQEKDKQKVTPVDRTSQDSLQVSRKLFRDWRSISESEFERLAIAYGVCNIFNFPEKDAERMTTEELKTLLKKRIKK